MTGHSSFPTQMVGINEQSHVRPPWHSHTYLRLAHLCSSLPSSDFLDEEEVVDMEDEAEIVGTQEPKKPSHPSHTSHTSNLSRQHSRPGPTPPGNDVEEEEEDRPDEEKEEEAAESVVRRSKQSRFGHRVKDLDRDWGRDHTKGSVRQVTRRELMEAQDTLLMQPDMESVLVRSRSLSWVRSAPAEGGAGRKGGEAVEGPAAAAAAGGEKGAEVPPKPKSSLLFAQKTSLSALASQAKQILSNSAHSNSLKTLKDQRVADGKKDKREENKIYITRPRPAREREREQRRERREERGSRYPREVFPGVFLYHTGKTTRLVNLGAKGHARGVITRDRSRVSAHQLWPNPPPREGKTLPRNASINTWNETPLKAANRPAGPRQTDTGKKKVERIKATPVDLPSKVRLPTAEPHRQDPEGPPVTPPRSNSTEDTPQSQVRVTSYLRTSEITESHQQPEPEPNPGELERDTNRSNPDRDPEPEPEPEPEEGEMSDYSYEEVEARPGWAEESINWQRTFSVNPMDFELLRSDWNDLRCNVSGNLQLAESEVVDVLAQYMEKLNERNGG